MFTDLDRSHRLPMATPRKIEHPIPYEVPLMAVRTYEAQTQVEKHLGLIGKIRAVNISNWAIPIGLHTTVTGLFISQLSDYLPKLNYPKGYFIGAALTGAATALMAWKRDHDCESIAKYIEQNPQLPRTNSLLLQRAEELANGYLLAHPTTTTVNHRWDKYL